MFNFEESFGRARDILNVWFSGYSSFIEKFGRLKSNNLKRIV